MTLRPLSQRGFMLVVAIFLIVIAAALASVITLRVIGGSESTIDTTTHAQALYLAHTGIERWIRQRSLSNAFTGEAATAFANGTFTTTTDTVNDCSGAALAANRVSVTSVGNVAVTGASARVCAVIDLLRLGGAMMVYAEETSAGVPVYRRWSHATSAWGARAVANDVGPIIQYFVLKFARTRNEAILVTMDSNGDIDVQIWNGTAWGAVMNLANVGITNDAYRGFDVDYESQNDRAVVVYNNANSRNPAYRIWDGTAWTAAASITLGSNYNTTSAQEPLWIQTAANPLGNSNEIVLITLDDDQDVYGARWNGTAWSRMSAATGSWETTAATDTRQAIDVAYEQLSGEALFIFGDNAADTQFYRTWDGTTLGAITTLTIVAQGGTPDWMRLFSQPNSNQIMYGVQDSGADLNTAMWGGAAFTVHAEHDTGTENVNSRNFDFVFETHPTRAGRGWLVWGDGATVSTREWTGAAWNAAGAVAGSDDTSFTRLAAQPSSGAIFVGVYENNGSGGGVEDDIYEMHQTGGSGVFTALAQIWNGGTVADPVQYRIDIAPERYTPIVSWREVLP